MGMHCQYNQMVKVSFCVAGDSNCGTTLASFILNTNNKSRCKLNKTSQQIKNSKVPVQSAWKGYCPDNWTMTNVTKCHLSISPECGKVTSRPVHSWTRVHDLLHSSQGAFDQIVPGCRSLKSRVTLLLVTAWARVHIYPIFLLSFGKKCFVLLG